MSHLIPLKQRLRSIRTTRRVTHAMRLISRSLYSKLEKKRIPLDLQRKQIETLLLEYLPFTPHWSHPVLFPEDILSSNPLFIIIAPTKGFCGSMTANLFNFVDRALFVEEHQSPEFITIGSKATEFVKDRNLGPIIYNFHDLNSNNYDTTSQHITSLILEKTPCYSSVTVYTSLLKNFFFQVPNKTEIIPLVSSLHNMQTAENNELTEPIWEQDKTEIIEFLAHTHLNNMVTYTLFQALISEYASRFMTMDSATTNADNYLDVLTLQFNKLRQGLITKEVAELSSSL